MKGRGGCFLLSELAQPREAGILGSVADTLEQVGPSGGGRPGGFPDRAAPFLLVLLVLLLAWPALAPDRTWYSADGALAFQPWKGALHPRGRHPRNPDVGDQDFLYYPFLRFMAREWAERGKLPLWNPHLYGGVPLAGNAQFPLLYPVHGLLWLSQAGKSRFDPAAFDRAFTWHALVRLLMAVLGGWFWARRLWGGGPGAWAAATVLGLGGYMVLWLQFTPAQVFCFLPPALFFLEGFLSRRKGLDLLLFGLCFAASNLGGYPQTSFFLGGFLWVYVFLRAGWNPKVLLPFGLAFLAGCLLALPSWLPFLEYLGHSEIRVLRAAEKIWPGGIPKWEVLAAGAAGLLLLLAAARTGRAGTRKGLAWGVFLALLGLLLLDDHRLGGDGQLFHLFFPGAWGRPEAGTWRGPVMPNFVEVNCDYLGAAPLFLFLLFPFLPGRKGRLPAGLFLLGVFSWLYGAQVPLLNQVGRKLLFLAQASRAGVLFPLAAGGLSAWVLGRLAGMGREERRKLLFPLGLLALAALAGYGAWAGGLWSPGRPRPHLTVRDGLFFASSLAGLAWLLSARRTPVPSLLLAGLLALDLLSFGRGFNPATPLEEIYPETPSIAWLERAGERAEKEGRPFRVMGDGMTFRPDTPCVYGLSDARGHDCFDPSRYVLLLYGLLKDPATLPQEVGCRTMRVDRRAFDLLGVRYVVTARSWKAPPGWKEVYRGPGAGIYENLDALPRAYLAKDQVWIHRRPVPFFDPRIDPKETVFFEDASLKLSGKAFQKGEARIVEDSPDRVRIRTQADGWAWLVLLDNYYPGWEALLDGKEPLTIHRAYGTFRAVAVPPGRHRVTFTYRPRPWRSGLLGAFAGLVLLFASAWLSSRREAP